METTKVTISLNIQANSKFIAHNEKVFREMVELLYFYELGLRKEDIGSWIYQLTFKHTDEDDLKCQFSELLDNIWSTADGYYCIVESDVDESSDYSGFRSSEVHQKLLLI